jgi:hypothetical protein
MILKMNGPGPGLWSRRTEGERVVWDGMVMGGSTQSGSVKVSIVEGAGAPADLYVYDPPVTLREHPHGPCLQLMAPTGLGLFRMHFVEPPSDARSAYSYLERMLKEVAETQAANRAPSLLDDLRPTAGP